MKFDCSEIVLFDLVKLRLYVAYVNCQQHLDIFSEILVMLGVLQISVFRASLIFQKRYKNADYSS